MRLARRWGWLWAQSLAASIGFGLCFGTGIKVIGFLLRQEPPLAVDIAMIAVLVAVLGVATVVSGLAQRSFARGPASAPPELVSEGLGWVEVARENRWLASAMIACGVVGYLAAVGGTTTLVCWSRGRPWASGRYAHLIVFGVGYALAWRCIHWGLMAIRRIARHGRCPGDPAAPDRLWDRDLDHDLATESRPAS